MKNCFLKNINLKKDHINPLFRKNFIGLSKIILGSAILFACSEINLIGGQKTDQGPGPDILVDPPSLTFGQLSVGQEEILSFDVQNIGDATLHVTDVVIGSGLSFTIATQQVLFDLEPGMTQGIEVTFTPMGSDENFGQALVLSDDPDTPQASVDLLGYGAIPELKITPNSYVFGDTFIPCGTSVELKLENVGSEDLEIINFDYTSAGMLSLIPQSIPALPLTLAPGEFENLTVSFEASTNASDTGRLDVTSNDPRGIVSADQNGEGSYEQTLTEMFTEPGIPPVDVLMLIDQSCSMEEDNRVDVQNCMPDFVAELQQTSDWQLIEVTRVTGCSNGGVLTPASSNVESTLINNAFNAGQHQYTESLLQLADIALSKTVPGECNEGFLRPGALLHVVVMSDEREQSGRTGGYWVGQLENYVSSPDYLKVSGVLDLNRACGDGSGATGYVEAVTQTGGSSLNICNANWGANFGDIASEVLAGIRTYNLSEDAIPESVEVTVNGVPTSDFSVNGNDVTVENPPVGEGDVVEITYGVSSECL